MKTKNPLETTMSHILIALHFWALCLKVSSTALPLASSYPTLHSLVTRHPPQEAFPTVFRKRKALLHLCPRRAYSTPKQIFQDVSQYVTFNGLFILNPQSQPQKWEESVSSLWMGGWMDGWEKGKKEQMNEQSNKGRNKWRKKTKNERKNGQTSKDQRHKSHVNE